MEAETWAVQPQPSTAGATKGWKRQEGPFRMGPAGSLALGHDLTRGPRPPAAPGVGACRAWPAMGLRKWPVSARRMAHGQQLARPEGKGLPLPWSQ